MQTISSTSMLPIFNTRETGISFTQIRITKFGKRFISEFDIKYTNIHNKISVSIYAKSLQECIDKTENFLTTKLKPFEITLP